MADHSPAQSTAQPWDTKPSGNITWAVEQYNAWAEKYEITALCKSEEDANVIAYSEGLSEGGNCRVTRMRTDYTVLEYVGNDKAKAAVLREEALNAA